MSTEQPEAFRLAAGLDELLGYRGINPDIGKAASELRRLHQITINQSHEMRLLLEACQIALDSDDRSVKDVLRAAITKATGEEA
jgi:hypothetical protein